MNSSLRTPTPRTISAMRAASLLLLLAFAAPATALPPDDRYLAGYAAAILEREFKTRAPSLVVQDGAVTLDAADLGDADPDAVRAALASIPGVAGVRIGDGDVARAAEAAAAPEEPPTREARREAAERVTGFLPRGQLFRALLADPRWPRFSATYQYYIDDDELTNVGAANFGATVPLYRADSRLLPDAQWEAGLQAGVFSVFDLDAESKDLINADYFVALMAAYRTGDVSAIGRLFHQSSHLGDEFLLRNRADRVNLSYEGVDAKLSWDVLEPVRIYGGGGYLFDQEPADLEPAVAQYGLEVLSPRSFADGTVTPVAAADFQHTEESNWATQYSIMGGLQLERVRIADTALIVAAEWFRGHSPNGQFYRRKVEWVGIGAHLYF